MQISVWQQFSSNHSANFDLVATFSTSKEAEKFFLELRDFFEKYWRWWLTLGKDNSERGAVFIDKRQESQYSPIQIEFIHKYSLQSDQFLDWIIWAENESTFEQEMAETLAILGNHIFLNSPLEIWYADYTFFSEYMNKIGAELAVSGSEVVGTMIEMFILCKAPSPKDAQTITDMFLKIDKSKIWDSTWIFKDIETYFQEEYFCINKIHIVVWKGSQKLADCVRATIEYFEQHDCEVQYGFYAE
jgi:hypothetical protein